MKETGKNTILFLDFDGTLVDIRATPGEIFLDKAQWGVLEDLASKHFLFVLSGRSFPDIQKRVPTSLTGIAGDHGAVRQFGEELFIIPEAHEIKDLVKALGNSFSSVRKQFHKVLIEEKDYSISVHYRNISPILISELHNTISGIKKQIDPFNELIETTGKCVWEFRHPEARKEKALEWFVEKLKEHLPENLKRRYVFIGDDLTDWNSIIWAEESGGKGIWIGEKYPHPIGEYRPEKFNSPKEVWGNLMEWSTNENFIPFSD